jgi:hypothetical protein
VEDNGIGFTPENMKSFETLDSVHKASLGCRGFGRLLWLKAFRDADIQSVYRDREGELRGQCFKFSTKSEIEPLDEMPGLDTPGTLLNLNGFLPAYQKNAPKTAETIAREIFEHCISYFLRLEDAPLVSLKDGEELIWLNDLRSEVLHSEMPTRTLEVKGEKFEMTSLQLVASTRNSMPRLHWRAANRVVSEEILAGTVPGLTGKLKEEHGKEFTYTCYLSSKFLDDRVRADRTAFDIGNSIDGEVLLEDISMEDIREAVLGEVAKVGQPFGGVGTSVLGLVPVSHTVWWFVARIGSGRFVPP